MKIILIENVKGVGEIGDVVIVKDGYARNYLIPKGLARTATSSNVKVIEEERNKLLRLKEKEKTKAQQLAEKVSNTSCTVSVRAGQDDKLFGAVTNEDIARVCEAEGIKIDKHRIQLGQPIKKLGVYQIPVKLHPDVVATLKIWVVKE